MNRKNCVALALLYCTLALLSGQSGKPGNGTGRLDSSRFQTNWSVTIEPLPLLTSYYDYFLASYNDLPLCVLPQSAGGGYFATWHGKRSPVSNRRVFYAYLNEIGNVINTMEIADLDTNEGYPALALDPVSGKPFYAWNGNGDADQELEIRLTSDQFIAGIPGLFNPIINVIDNPITITAPNGTITTDNVFIWPSLAIGPSPITGKRRIYVLARNSTMHNGSLSANPYIAWADFDATDIANGLIPAWNFTSIGQLDDWNVTAGSPRLSCALAADGTGNLYYAGYHYDTDLTQPDLDVWVCDNFGTGTWTHISFNSNLPTWNPPATPTGTAGYFTNDQNVPYTNNQLFWRICNSGHLNAALDNQGRLHIIGLWGLHNSDGAYYPNLQFVKDAVWDPALTQFQIKDVFPQADPGDGVNTCFQPWDLEEPWGVVDSWGGNATAGWYPDMLLDWPFPHWDETAHQDIMMFAYNNIKVTWANSQGQMAAVWVDSWRARQWHGTQDPEYAAFANTPEIYIAYSPNSGFNWSEPIILNNVETDELAGIKPIWVYPADQIIYTGMQDYEPVGKLGLLFYDDYTWGSNSLSPPYHPTPDGGRVMFMELQIGGGTASEDPGLIPAQELSLRNWPNPFNPSTSLSFELPAPARAKLCLYDLRGRWIRTLLDEELTAGAQSAQWDGTDASGRTLPSGMYFCRLQAGDMTATHKLLLLK